MSMQTNIPVLMPPSANTIENKFHLFGVVMVYNPDVDVANNIKSYLNAVDKLYVVDNSIDLHEDLLDAFSEDEQKKLQYIPFGENKGISYVLNFVLFGLKNAGNRDFLITLDQDTSFQKGEMERYWSEIQKQYSRDTSCVSFSAYPWDASIKENHYASRVITSTNVIHVQTARNVGGFNEKLFVDEVDYEFSYRLREHGYRIMIIQNVGLNHRIGTPKTISFFGMKMTISHHSPKRHYYMTRNRLYNIWHHPRYALGEYRDIYTIGEVKNIIGILLYDDQKLDNLKSFFSAFIDFLMGRMGEKKNQIA